MAQPSKLHALQLLPMAQSCRASLSCQFTVGLSSGVETATENLLSGMLLSGDPGDGDGVAAKHQQLQAE